MFRALEDFIAGIALIGLCKGFTGFTISDNEAICQEHGAGSTMQLFDLFFNKEPVFIAFHENLLYNVCMDRTSGSSKMIIRDIEPLIDFLVNLVIVAAYCFWSCFFHFGLDLSTITQ